MSNDSEFSESQLGAIQLIEDGKNIFLTGMAGSGKSFLLTSLSRLFPSKNIILTSTTGISAFNIGGCTIHSYLSLGLGDQTVGKSLFKMQGGRKKHIQKLDILIIDEVSMLSSALTEKIHQSLQKVRNNYALFGDVQIILSGDLLQLETIGT